MSQTIHYMGKPVRKRNKWGQFRKKGMSPIAAILLIAMMTGAMVYYNRTIIFADEPVQQVQVTASVALDCTQPTHMYTEDCVKRFTDMVAEATVLKKQTSVELQSAQEADDNAGTLLEKALDNYNTVYGN